MNAFLCEQSADSIKEENNYLFISRVLQSL